MTTIAISVDEDLLRRAERVAERRQTTVADMLAVAVQTIGDGDLHLDKLPPITRSAIGLARDGGPIRPYKEMLVEALLAKYGLSE